jgi:peptidoglycan/xylan/chitin deacetylase (PgdA/CDA1 family)
MLDAFRRIVHYFIAVFCHYSGLDAWCRRRRGTGLAVLMFHRVRDERDPYPLSITPQSFVRLVRWLRRRDLLVDLDSGLAGLQQTDAGTRYALTFDDGYRDNLALLDIPDGVPPAVFYLATAHIGGESVWAYRLAHALQQRSVEVADLEDIGLGTWPLNDSAAENALLEHLNRELKQLPFPLLDSQMNAIVARMAPRLDRDQSDQMLSWDEVRKLHNAGITIGAHTVNHAILSRIDIDRAREEIGRSREQIEREIAHAPRHFAYPNGSEGDYGPRDIELVRQIGFASAVTTIEGVNTRDEDRYQLRRHNVYEQRFRSPFGWLSQALFFSGTSGVLDWLRTRTGN